jgi:F-type H+-transporting ATPase subunit a
MPEHTSFFTYLLAMFPALRQNMSAFGDTFLGHQHVDVHGAEPIVSSIFIMLLVLVLAVIVSPKLRNQDSAVIPETKLTLRTFFEVWIGYWYGLMKDMMGPKRAKQYFPLVGSLSVFIVFSNFLGLIPGFTPPTSNWNVTLGCAALVFVMFNFYGFQANGMAYAKHLFGPWLGLPYIPVNILLFVVETFSLFIRPLTLSIRLMLNMAVDHLLVTIMLGMVAVLLPIPVLILGTLVAIVQVMVFCILTSIYITLATEHDEHEADAHGHAEGAAHAAGAGA